MGGDAGKVDHSRASGEPLRDHVAIGEDVVRPLPDHARSAQRRLATGLSGADRARGAARSRSRRGTKVPAAHDVHERTTNLIEHLDAEALTSETATEQLPDESTATGDRDGPVHDWTAT